MLRKIFFCAALIVTCAAFVYLYSTSTSPRYLSLGDDSAIFQAVGKIWAQGRLPYVDAFENKGPLIFLVDAIGYAVAPRAGIMLLQIPAMCVSFLMAWRALGVYLSGGARVAAAVFTLIFYALYSLDGNRTEEWSMPLLMAATYLFLRGLKSGDFSPRVALVYGVGFGACVLLRATNALPICCYVALTAAFLLKAGDFQTLRRNVISFCAGVAIIVLPFVIYFAAHGALYDMLYGTILLNVVYTAQRENFLLTHLAAYVEYVVVNFMPLYAMIVLSAVEFAIKKSRLALSGIFCGAMMLLMMFKLSPYSGYCALIAPLLPIFFAVLCEFAENFRDLWSSRKFSFKRTACKVVVLIAMIYPLTVAALFANKFVEANSDFVREFNRTEINELLRLRDVIPPDERDSVAMWGEGFCTSHFVLATGILPRGRFFNNVKAFADVDSAVKREWLESARGARWIVYSVHKSELDGDVTTDWIYRFRQNRDLDVERLLNERYRFIAEAEIYQNAFRLYRARS